MTQGHQPVAALISLDNDGSSATEPAHLAPDLYDDHINTPFQVQERLRQWQQKFGLPQRPDGQIRTSAQELFATWAEEDTLMTPEEVAAEQQNWEKRQQDRQEIVI